MHRSALTIAFIFGAVASIIQPLSGDFSAKDVAKRQPEKFAAMEAHFHTESSAPLLIGGIPDEESMNVSWGIKIPGMLSFLAHGNTSQEVIGLEEFDRSNWPPVLLTHLSFQVMVGLGMILLFVSVVGLFFLLKKRHLFTAPWFLKLLCIVAPMGMIAIEAGWMVTELGRQPWIIYRVMKVKEALTPMPGIWVPFLLFFLLYLFLFSIVIWLFTRQVKWAHRQEAAQ